ncbi:MAG TPA: 5'-nucleotidase [Bacteroidales bacterium]|nr:5'-nucleotidase [Bacteroidales bacterium]
MTNRIIAILSIVVSGVILNSCTSHLFLQEDKTQGAVIKIDTINVPETDSVSIKIIVPYKEQLDAQMNEVIAYSDVAMKKSLPEGLLNNFTADVVLKMGNSYLKKLNKDTASICLLNTGGLRCDIPKGSITVRNIFELMPFENEMVAVTINGKNAKKMFNFIAKKGGMPLSGAFMSIESDTAKLITLNNAAFDITKDYTVITSDYLALGGDDMTFFGSPVSYVPMTVKIRDVLIEYLKAETAKDNTVSSKLDKRIYYEK